MTIQYRIFGFHNKNPQVSLNEIHPLLAGGQHGYIALTSQEEDILKVAFYYDENLEYRARFLFIPNPSQRDFTGIPARYVTDSQVEESFLPMERFCILPSLRMPALWAHQNGCMK